MGRGQRRLRDILALAAPAVRGEVSRRRDTGYAADRWSEESLVELIETVAAVSAAAPTIADAMLGCIRSMCQWTGWPVAHVYVASTEDSSVLISSEFWHVADRERFAPFVEATMATELARGVGLPGRVMASGRPAWIADVARDPNFPRGTVCGEVGLHGALAFSLPVDGRCYAVVECFALEPVACDPRLLEVVGHIGAQLGRLIHAMQTAEALRESDTRFRSVAESASDAIIAANTEGMIVSWNRGAALMFGYTEGEVMGRPLSILMPERFRELHDTGLKRVADHGLAASRVIGQTVEVTGLRKDGREFPLELSLATWDAPEGRYFSGIIRDITERKKAEDKIKALLETAPDPIVEVDGEGRVVLANARTDELFGYSREEVVGRPIERLFAPRSRDLVAEYFAAVLRGSSSGLQLNGLEIFGQRKDGGEFPVDVTLSGVDTEGNKAVTAIVRDVTERKRFEAQLRHLADHDALTGLFNRRRFEEEVTAYCEHAARYGEEGALMVLDLDRFKLVNDTHGHSVGDEVIRVAAGALVDAVRKTDVVARLGGDEFAVLIKNADRSEVERISRSMIRRVRDRRLPIEGSRASMTTSLGVAVFGDQEPSVEDLLVSADLAMYAAKDAGGNRLEFATDDGRHLAGMQARLGWVDQIRRALDEDRFVIYCQPILDLKTNTVTQYELLIRMIGEDGNIVMPAAFIEVAERYGLIREIDRWVLRQAIQLLNQRRADGERMRVEVNLSGKSMDDPELLSMIERELQITGADPGDLIIEITETAAIADMERARAFADRLTALGCRFALDDFGSGFSSFYYLKYLPLNYLKIDGDFIRGMTSSPTDQLVVKAMVDIAQGMGMKTIAEFVETPETVSMLQTKGVDYSQGYYHGKPRPVAEILVPAVPQPRGATELVMPAETQNVEHETGIEVAP